jgi:hypothetical protein
MAKKKAEEEVPEFEERDLEEASTPIATPPIVEREIKHKPKPITDSDGHNQSGCPRPKIYMSGGREGYLTRSLLKQIGNFDSEGRPLSRDCEDPNRVLHWTQLLDRWEGGEMI